MEITKKQVDGFIESLKKDNKKLRTVKILATKLGQYDFAANLRDMELECFPETDEQKAAEERAKKLNLIFRMVELNIQEDIAWLIEATVKKYHKRRGNFDLKDAAELMEKRREYFRIE